MTWKYFMPELGETIDDAKPVMRSRYDFEKNEIIDEPAFCVDHRDAAEMAAGQCRHQHDLEWHKGEQTISVVDNEGHIKTFEVEIEYEPTFSATEKR